MLFLFLTIRYGRRELAPQLSQTAFVTLLMLALAGAFVACIAIKTVLADELWLFTFGWTVWFCIPFVIPMMLRRNSSVGQSRIGWIAYIGMTLSFWTAVWPLAPFFHSTIWLMLGAMIVIWALVVIYFIRRLPAPAPQSFAAAHSGASLATS